MMSHLSASFNPFEDLGLLMKGKKQATIAGVKESSIQGRNSGFRAGDLLVAVNGISVEGLSATNAAAVLADERAKCVSTRQQIILHIVRPYSEVDNSAAGVETAVESNEQQSSLSKQISTNLPVSTTPSLLDSPGSFISHRQDSKRIPRFEPKAKVFPGEGGKKTDNSISSPSTATPVRSPRKASVDNLEKPWHKNHMRRNSSGLAVPVEVLVPKGHQAPSFLEDKEEKGEDDARESSRTSTPPNESVSRDHIPPHSSSFIEVPIASHSQLSVPLPSDSNLGDNGSVVQNVPMIETTLPVSSSPLKSPELASGTQFEPILPKDVEDANEFRENEIRRLKEAQAAADAAALAASEAAAIVASSFLKEEVQRRAENPNGPSSHVLAEAARFRTKIRHERLFESLRSAHARLRIMERQSGTLSEIKEGLSSSTVVGAALSVGLSELESLKQGRDELLVEVNLSREALGEVPLSLEDLDRMDAEEFGVALASDKASEEPISNGNKIVSSEAHTEQQTNSNNLTSHTSESNTSGRNGSLITYEASLRYIEEKLKLEHLRLVRRETALGSVAARLQGRHAAAIQAMQARSKVAQAASSASTSDNQRKEDKLEVSSNNPSPLKSQVESDLEKTSTINDKGTSGVVSVGFEGKTSSSSFSEAAAQHSAVIASLESETIVRPVLTKSTPSPTRIETIIHNGINDNMKSRSSREEIRPSLNDLMPSGVNGNAEQNGGKGSVSELDFHPRPYYVPASARSVSPSFVSNSPSTPYNQQHNSHFRFNPTVTQNSVVPISTHHLTNTAVAPESKLSSISPLHHPSPPQEAPLLEEHQGESRNSQDVDVNRTRSFKDTSSHSDNGIQSYTVKPTVISLSAAPVSRPPIFSTQTNPARVQVYADGATSAVPDPRVVPLLAANSRALQGPSVSFATQPVGTGESAVPIISAASDATPALTRARLAAGMNTLIPSVFGIAGGSAALQSFHTTMNPGEGAGVASNCAANTIREPFETSVTSGYAATLGIHLSQLPPILDSRVLSFLASPAMLQASPRRRGTVELPKRAMLLETQPGVRSDQISPANNTVSTSFGSQYNGYTTRVTGAADGLNGPSASSQTVSHSAPSSNGRNMNYGHTPWEEQQRYDSYSVPVATHTTTHRINHSNPNSPNFVVPQLSSRSSSNSPVADVHSSGLNNSYSVFSMNSNGSGHSHRSHTKRLIRASNEQSISNAAERASLESARIVQRLNESIRTNSISSHALSTLHPSSQLAASGASTSPASKPITSKNFGALFVAISKPERPRMKAIDEGINYD